MPIIIDANCISGAFSEPPEAAYLPIIKALLQRKATLVVGGKLSDEYRRVATAVRFVSKLEQAGIAKVFAARDVMKREKDIVTSGLCVSNDTHVIALAQLSGARLLCSHDVALHSDFCNKDLIDKPRGHIYQNTAHEHLIKTYGA